MNLFRSSHYVSTFLLALLLIGFSSPLIADQAVDSPKVASLLTRANNYARQAARNAETLKSFTNSQISWQSHASELQAMKEHLNALGKVARDLKDNRDQGSPWQQEAIDRIDPLLRSMADQLTSTINHLNENRNQLRMTAYREYAAANDELASKTAAVISDFVQYGKAKSRAKSLEKQLELSTAGNGY